MFQAEGRPVRALLFVLLGVAMIAPASHAGDADSLMVRFDRMVRFNLDNPAVVPSATLDSVAVALAQSPLGARVAGWARWFVSLGTVGYRYGRDPGGYVTEGRLCQDFETDCVLFMTRVTELARSSSAREAVQFAFGTRFYGASIARAVRDDGRVDYDDPVHLDYSEDMINSAIWGENVSALCGRAVRDTIGSSRVPPDTLTFVPTAALDESRLQDGDIAWFVGDENHTGGAAARQAGTMIHHLGILFRHEGQVYLAHPASRPLAGIYEKPGLVSLPLRVYLGRVGKFKGIVVTRLKEF